MSQITVVQSGIAQGEIALSVAELMERQDYGRQLINVVVPMQPTSISVDELHHEIGELQTTLSAIQKQLLDAKMATPLASGTIVLAILTIFSGLVSFYASVVGKVQFANLLLVPFVVGLMSTAILWLVSYWR